MIGGMVRVGKKTAISEYLKGNHYTNVVEYHITADTIVDFSVLQDNHTLVILHNFKSLPGNINLINAITESDDHHNNLICIDTNINFDLYQAQFIRLDPIDFGEFCEITGASVEKGHNMAEILDIYLTVGGMPEAIKLFREDSHELRYKHERIRLHKEITEDISKSFKGDIKLVNVMCSMPNQTKKFKISQICGDRPTLKKYKNTLEQLRYIDSIIRIPQVNGDGVKYIPADIALLPEGTTKEYIEKVYVGIALRKAEIGYYEVNKLPGSKSKKLYGIDYIIGRNPLQVHGNNYRGFDTDGVTTISCKFKYESNFGNHRNIPLHLIKGVNNE